MRRHVLWLCDRCGDHAEVEPGGICEVCLEGTIQVVDVVAVDALLTELRDENGKADSAIGQAIQDAQRQGLGIIGTARAIRQALALELAHKGGADAWAIANAAGEIMDDVPAFKTLRQAAAHLHAQTPEETPSQESGESA